MCIFIFYTTFVWNIFHSKKNWERYDQICVLFFMWSTCNSCRVLAKVEFYQQFFEKYSSIKFHENLSSVSRVVPCGLTDGRTERYEEANSRFSRFCEGAEKVRVYKMCVLTFSTSFSEKFLILRRMQQDTIVNVYRTSRKVPLLLSDLIKFEFSRRIFENYTNIKLQENPSCGSRIFPCRRTDMMKLNVSFWKFCECD
jgi:hypothetical protein